VIEKYWHYLTERERWMVVVGTVCALLYLFYFLLYQPLRTAVNTKTRQLLEKQETLVWMQQVRQQPKKNQPTTQVINNSKLLALIGNQLSNNGLRQFTYQLQQTGSGDIQLSYEQVPFKPFLIWLWNLHNDYAITLKLFTAECTNTPGVVKQMIVITAVNT
jgi:general secretion pathway protein M